MAVIKHKKGMSIVHGTTADGIRVRQQFSEKRYGSKYKDIAQRKYEELLFDNSGLVYDSLTRKTRILREWTVKDLAGKYREEHLENTRATGNASYLDLICRKWGDHRLAHISKAVVRPWIHYLLNNEYAGKRYSAYTVLKIARYFQRIFNWGVEMDFLNDNPLNRLIDMQLKKQFKRLCRPRRVTMGKAEVFEVMDIMPEYARRVVCMAWHTGMRMGEIVALKWPDVHGDILYIEDTKECEPKPVILEREAVTMLTEMQVEQIANGQQDYVFLGETGKPLRVDVFSKTFRWYANKAGYKTLRYHDIRHMYQQRKRREGVDRRVIDAQLGHRSVRDMGDVYDCITAEDLKALVSKPMTKNDNFLNSEAKVDY